MKSFRKIAQIAIPLTLLLVPLAGLALVQPTNPVDNTGPLDLAGLEAIIQKVANFLITVSIVIAVGFIVWGAIIWMSAGGNDERAGKGRKFIWNGILGAAIVFAVGLILSTLKSTIASQFFTR